MWESRKHRRVSVCVYVASFSPLSSPSPYYSPTTVPPHAHTCASSLLSNPASPPFYLFIVSVSVCLLSNLRWVASRSFNFLVLVCYLCVCALISFALSVFVFLFSLRAGFFFSSVNQISLFFRSFTIFFSAASLFLSLFLSSFVIISHSVAHRRLPCVSCCVELCVCLFFFFSVCVCVCARAKRCSLPVHIPSLFLLAKDTQTSRSSTN